MKKDCGFSVGVVTAFPPSVATLNEYGYHLVNALADDPRVARVHVLADRIGEHEGPSAASHDRVSLDRCWDFDSLTIGRNVSRAARSAELDCVIFNSHFRSFGQSSVASALGLLSAPGLSLTGLPSILILHNLVDAVDLSANGMASNPAVEKLLRFAGTTLTHMLLRSSCVSVLLPNYAALLREKYGARNILHIPHGTFGRVRSEPVALPEGPPRILAFGKFGTYKKVEVLLEAARLLQREGRRDVEVVIAGTDSPNTPGYLDSVRERFRDVAQVRFLGYIPEAEVESTLASATVVVLPYTTTTGSSGVLHQIGQVGRAVVYPDIDDLAVLTRSEGYQGEAFVPESPESLARAMCRLLDDPEHRRAIERVNLRASAGFTMGDVACAYVDAVVELCSRDAQAPTSTRDARWAGPRPSEAGGLR